MRFSIIVPVYNVEKYLEQCIKSILEQTYPLINYEVILINDGSSDNSQKICDIFAGNYSNVKVICQENQGLSSARNTGIKNALGEYLIFIDGDDYIESESLKEFEESIIKNSRPDVLVTKMKKVFNGSNPKYMDSHIISGNLVFYDKSIAIDTMFNQSKNLWPAVRYIVKRSFVKEHNLSFPRGFLHEDVEWTSKVFLYSTSHGYCDLYWYNHRMGRNNSITTVKNPQRVLDVIALVSKNINDDAFNRLNEKDKQIIFERMTRSVFSTLRDYGYFDKTNKKKIIASLKNEREIFKYTSRLPHKLFYGTSQIFGFRVAFKLLGIMKN